MEIDVVELIRSSTGGRGTKLLLRSGHGSESLGWREGLSWLLSRWLRWMVGRLLKSLLR
jgi:hypothetical protein